jgi:hypothetical protein
MKLEDLSKAELLELFYHWHPELREDDHEQAQMVLQRDLRRIRARTLNRKADLLATQAQEKMDANKGGDRAALQRFLDASKEFDRISLLLSLAVLCSACETNTPPPDQT